MRFFLLALCLFCASLLILPAVHGDVSTGEWSTEAWTYTFPLGKELIFRHEGPEPFYADVQVPYGVPLRVRLTPLEGDFDLEVWGRGQTDRDPYSASGKSGMIAEEVLLLSEEDNWYTIRVTPFQHGGGRFKLMTEILSEEDYTEETAGFSPGNPLPLKAGIPVEGAAGQNRFYRLELEPYGRNGANKEDALILLLTPAEADLDLSLMELDQTRREGEEPAAAMKSSLAGTQTERLRVEDPFGRSFLIEVSAASKNPSAFTLNAYLERQGKGEGASEETAIPVGAGEAVFGYCKAGDFLYYQLDASRLNRDFLTLELVPHEAGLNLEVWGEEAPNYSPYIAEFNEGTKRERISLDLRENRRFVIRISALERGSNFTLKSFPSP